MTNVWIWIKTHKAATILIVIVLYFVSRVFSGFYGISTTSMQLPALNTGSAGISTSSPSYNSGSYQLSKSDSSYSSGAQMVAKTSELSMVVNDVRSAGDNLIKYAQNQGGYMVSATYNRPSESASATITIRVSSQKLEQTLSYIRSVGMKVTSETISGTDITNSYKDIAARLSTLQTTQARFQEILVKATTVQDILSVQQQLILLQDQIDMYKGQKQALEQEADLSKITIYLSTDEYALPYVPDQTFRPGVIFKEAIRSLVGAARAVGTLFIWIVVYSVIWIPLLVGVIFLKRWKRKTSTQTPVKQ